MTKNFDDSESVQMHDALVEGAKYIAQRNKETDGFIYPSDENVYDYLQKKFPKIYIGSYTIFFMNIQYSIFNQVGMQNLIKRLEKYQPHTMEKVRSILKSLTWK